MHRAHPEVTVEQGNHAVSLPPGTTVAGTSDVQILHFPLRSYAQFENKIAKGGAAYHRNRELPLSVGETWRFLYRELEAGRLRAHYDAEVMPDSARAAAITHGDLIEDRRLVDFMTTAGLM
jgi:hypothetical protein